MAMLGRSGLTGATVLALFAWTGWSEAGDNSRLVLNVNGDSEVSASDMQRLDLKAGDDADTTLVWRRGWGWGGGWGRGWGRGWGWGGWGRGWGWSGWGRGWGWSGYRGWGGYGSYWSAWPYLGGYGYWGGYLPYWGGYYYSPGLTFRYAMAYFNYSPHLLPMSVEM